MSKIVIQTWSTYFCNKTEFRFGIGDCIRGTIYLYNLCKKYNFKLYVSTILYPINKFLKNNTCEYDGLILENRNNIKYIPNNKDVLDEINKSKSNIVYFYTNISDTNINSDSREFIKNLLIPSDELNEEIERIINTFPFKDYSILHYRFFDHEFIHSDLSNFNLLQNYANKSGNKSLNDCNNALNNLIRNYSKDKNIILMTTSKSFKQKAVEKTGIFTLNLEICHLGYNYDDNSVKDTLIEFFIISRSTLIKAYSGYGWVSGFVNWISKIYNIPLIDICKK